MRHQDKRGQQVLRGHLLIYVQDCSNCFSHLTPLRHTPPLLILVWSPYVGDVLACTLSPHTFFTFMVMVGALLMLLHGPKPDVFSKSSCRQKSELP